MRIDRCRVLNLPRITDPRGNLTFIEGDVHVPFQIKRVYYLYDVPGGESRGGHAHRVLSQLLISVAGSLDVNLDDGFSQKTIHLNRAFEGLLIPTMVWRELTNFSSGSVCLVLASERYDESDYIRDYGAFRAAAQDAR